MPHTILQQRQLRCCRCNECNTIGIAIGEFVDKHPYVSFIVFIGIMFALMAIVGLNDGADRMAQLGGA